MFKTNIRENQEEPCLKPRQGNKLCGSVFLTQHHSLIIDGHPRKNCMACHDVVSLTLGRQPSDYSQRGGAGRGAQPPILLLNATSNWKPDTNNIKLTQSFFLNTKLIK